MSRALACIACAMALGAAAGQAAAQDPTPPLGPGSLLQVLFGLALVLALVVATAWVLRRVGRVPGLTNQAIKTVGAAALGTRERVVLLEISGTWILVGVAPGRVSQLATMPKGEVAAATAAIEPPPFAAWLKRFSEGRNAH